MSSSALKIQGVENGKNRLRVEKDEPCGAPLPSGEAILQSLRRMLSKVVDFDCVTLLLLNGSGDAVRVLALASSLSPSEGAVIPIKGTLIERVLDGQELTFVPVGPISMPDLPPLAWWTLLAPLGSACLFPVSTSRKKFGVLLVGDTPQREFSAGDFERMIAVASHIAITLEGVLAPDPAELYRQQLAEERDRLSLLLDLTNRITSNLDLHELLRAISATLRQVMECDGGVLVVLPDEESGQPWVYALDFPESHGFVSEELLVSRGGLGGTAFETLKPVIVNRLEQASAASEIGQRMISKGLQCICCVPLVSRGRALGLLVLARRQENSFRQKDAEFLGQVGAQIAIAVENALAYQEISALKDKLAQENLYLEEEIRSDSDFEQIIGKSPAIQHVLELVQTVAPSDSTVLLLGETGTGKELIARAIRDHSHRKDRTFVKLNCAAIPTGLLESELFGHEKGAFTGAIHQKIGRLELADQGTLFLDEVGDIPIEIQPKLLHTLQEREFERLGSTQTRKVNLRLIAATNRDLEQMISSREFRSDLYYRLNVFPIRVPPLRERREDIPLLVRYFVQRFARQMQKPIETIPSAALKKLTASDWPGNIRELENFMERAVILTRGKSLDLPLAELNRAGMDSSPTHSPLGEREEIARIVRETLGQWKRAARGNGHPEHLEKQRQQILEVLRETKGRVGGPQGAAARLGVNRTTLLSRMKKLSITPRQFS